MDNSNTGRICHGHSEALVARATGDAQRGSQEEGQEEAQAERGEQAESAILNESSERVQAALAQSTAGAKTGDPGGLMPPKKSAENKDCPDASR